MPLRIFTFGVLTTLMASTAMASTPAGSPPGPPEMVTLHSPDSPLIALRLLLKVGSIHDPRGKEGLAALTGLMIGKAGTEKRSYAELIDALYPMAASIEVNTDREVTVIGGVIHRDRLDQYTALLAETVLDPGFSESDFRRNKEQLLAYLTTTLRAANDELLGLEAIQQVVFAGHPYEHSPAGTVKGLESITLDDVKSFYTSNFTRSNLVIGVAGGYPEEYVPRLKKVLSTLPEGEAARPELPAPPAVEGREFFLLEKETDSVGIHLGYPLPVNRADPDYYPLLLANSYLGEHRTFHGRLMQQLRGKRGLNYGDYSYIEYWESPPFTNTPSPNVPRRQQYFSVWIRPVVPETAHFALRNAIYEIDRLVETGLTREEFELTRDYLISYSKLWAQTLSQRLGFLMDSRFYGTDYYIDEIEQRLRRLGLEEVNRAVRKYFQTERYKAVLVTRDADRLKADLKEDAASPMVYNSEVEEAVKRADRVIEKLEVSPTSIETVPVRGMFAD